MKFFKNPLLKRLDRDAYRLNFTVAVVAALILNTRLIQPESLELIFSILMGISFLVLAAMRCHDIGVSGWKQFIPGFHLYLLVAEGDKDTNQYGPVSDVPLSWFEDETHTNA